jgi:hypothetical protein
VEASYSQKASHSQPEDGFSLETRFTACVVLMQVFKERTRLYFYTTVKIIEETGHV